MRVELTAIGEIKNINNTKNNGRMIEDIDKETGVFFIKENERDEDLLLEATKIYIAIAKYLWKIQLQKDTNLVFQDIDIVVPILI